jgi:hypothetical protein
MGCASPIPLFSPCGRAPSRLEGSFSSSPRIMSRPAADTLPAGNSIGLVSRFRYASCPARPPHPPTHPPTPYPPIHRIPASESERRGAGMHRHRQGGALDGSPGC